MKERHTYETILRHLKHRSASTKPRTCPSLRSSIIQNKNIHVKNQLIAHSVQLPEEIVEQLPTKEYVAALITYHKSPCDAFLWAHKNGRANLLPHLLPEVFKQFENMCIELKGENVTVDALLDECKIAANHAVLSPKLLPILVSFALQRRPLLLNHLLLDAHYQRVLLDHLQQLLRYRPWPIITLRTDQRKHDRVRAEVYSHTKNHPDMFLSAVNHGQLHLAERFFVFHYVNWSLRPLLHKALMLAVQKGYIKFLTILLNYVTRAEKIALVSQKNNEQLTAVDYAVIYDRESILIQLCTLVTQIDPPGVHSILKSALMYACQYSRNTCVRIILASLEGSGAILETDILKEAFAQAVNYGQRETIQLLLGQLFNMPSVSPSELSDLSSLITKRNMCFITNSTKTTVTE